MLKHGGAHFVKKPVVIQVCEEAQCLVGPEPADLCVVVERLVLVQVELALSLELRPLNLGEVRHRRLGVLPLALQLLNEARRDREVVLRCDLRLEFLDPLDFRKSVRDPKKWEKSSFHSSFFLFFFLFCGLFTRGLRGYWLGFIINIRI